MPLCRGCGARHWIIKRERWQGWRGKATLHRIEAECKECGQHVSWEQERPWEGQNRPVGKAEGLSEAEMSKERGQLGAAPAVTHWG